MRLKHSFCNSENRIGSELLQVSEVSHKSWSLTIRLVIKRLHLFHMGMAVEDIAKALQVHANQVQEWLSERANQTE